MRTIVNKNREQKNTIKKARTKVVDMTENEWIYLTLLENYTAQETIE